MSDKLSEQLCMIAGALETTNPLRGRRIEHIAKKVAALEQQLAAKDAEIARLREDVSEKLQRLSLGRYDARNFRHEEQVISAQALDDVITALAETPAAHLTALALPEDDVPDAAPEVK